MIDKDQLADDQAALAAQQAADDAARAALASADASLQAAKDKLVADTTEYDQHQAEIAANPILGVLDEMDATVTKFSSQVGVGVTDLFRSLIAQARNIVQKPADTTSAPVADPVPAPAGTDAADDAGAGDSTADQGSSDAQAANEAPAGNVVNVDEPITLTPAGGAGSPLVGGAADEEPTA